MQRWLSSGLLRKILAALLVVSLIPLWIISGFALESYRASKDDVVERSAQNLDREAFEGLEGRTLALAQTVASFLEERESDLRLLATLPRTPESLADFARAKQGQLWTVTEEGDELVFETPIYRELAFIDSNGQELAKVTNECEDYPFSCEIVVSENLVDVSVPARTLFKDETYFSEAMALGHDEIYVGAPVGFYVPYERAYAGAQNRAGERYRGVLRFAMPVFEGDTKVGIVVSAVEMLHFIELTAHIAPANPELQAEIDPREADFVYVIDTDGWAISHPRHFNIAGVDEIGQRVPPIQEENRDDPDNLYRPGNLALMGFIDPAFPELVERNRQGRAGILTAHPWQGRKRVLAYATIPYYTGRYNNDAGFGLVVMSTDGARFHLEADLLGKQIENRIVELSNQMIWVAVATFVVGLVLALSLARTLAWPILRLMETAQRIEEGNWEEAHIDQLAETRGGDEVARLSRIFASMAKEVHTRERTLRRQVEELRIEIDEVKRQKQVREIVETDFFRDLKAKARIMRSRSRRKEQDALGEEAS